MIRDREPPLSAEGAEHLAIGALAFLASEEDELGRFLALAGIEAAMLRDAAADPAFLAGVLDYYLDNESLLLVFAARQNIRPDMIAAARRLLERGAT